MGDRSVDPVDIQWSPVENIGQGCNPDTPQGRSKPCPSSS